MGTARAWIHENVAVDERAKLNGDDREEGAEAGRTGDTVAVALCDAPIFVSGVHQDKVDRVEEFTSRSRRYC